MLTAVRSESVRRLSEARTLLSYIRTIEVPPPDQEPDIVYTLRGLCYVNLYAAWEYSIENAIQTALRTINLKNELKKNFVHSTLSWVLHSEFTSLAMVGPEKRWKKRDELLKAMHSSTNATINDSVFSSELQNIWPYVLEDIIAYLGISDNAIPEAPFKGYINEVVDKRNAIAHGRMSPKEVGITRAPELEKRYEAIEKTISHIFWILETHVDTNAFLTPSP